jgi:hypothetical protein
MERAALVAPAVRAPLSVVRPEMAVVSALRRKPVKCSL